MATAPFLPYGNYPAKLANKEIDLDSDSIVLTLHTSAYTPNLDTHAYVSDLTSELATGSGYTAGGVALTGLTRAYVAAAAWPVSAAVSTAYVVGDVRRPSASNGFLYRCVVAGTSAASAPAWPTTIGLTVTDGGVTWANVGRGAQVFDANDATWATATFTGVRYAVLSDRTPGTAATQPLLAVANFGTDQAGQGGSFVMQFAPEGILLGLIQA